MINDDVMSAAAVPLNYHKQDVGFVVLPVVLIGAGPQDACLNGEKRLDESLTDNSINSKLVKLLNKCIECQESEVLETHNTT